jgi:hypothetical protein
MSLPLIWTRRHLRVRRPRLAHLLVALLTAAVLVLVLAPLASGATAVTPRGTVTIVWDRTDLAGVQLANDVMVLPVAPAALAPVSHSLKLTSTISGGSMQTAAPYWGPVRYKGGIRFLKLTPSAHWTQVTVTRLTFNIRTQSVRASINGQAPVRFAFVNEMGMTDQQFTRGGHTYVRIRGASLSYAPKAAAALKAAFGYTVPAAPTPFASLAEVVRLN